MAMPGRLLVGVRIFDQYRLAEKPSEESESGGEKVVSPSHGNGNRREACLRRKYLAVIACRALRIANFARSIAPRGIDNSVYLRFIHGGDHGLAEGDLLFIVVDVQTWRARSGRGIFWRDG